MIENLFGGHGKGNNDILLILAVVFLLFNNNSKDDCYGDNDGIFGGIGNLFGGNNLIWIIAILFLFGGDLFGLEETQ